MERKGERRMIASVRMLIIVMKCEEVKNDSEATCAHVMLIKMINIIVEST